jgi:predicted nucleotidyltransferase
MVPGSRQQRNRDALERFGAACRDDPWVRAGFLGGSLAAGTDDEHSDLDIYVVISEEQCEQFFSTAHEFVARFGSPVSLIDVRNFSGAGFDTVLFTFDDGVEGELAIAHPGNMLKLHGGPHGVILDRDGLLDGVTFPLYAPSADEKRREVASALARFWREAIHVAKPLARGQPDGAIAALSRMRRSCEVIASADREPIPRSYVPLDEDAIGRAARGLVTYFEARGPAAAAEHGLSYPRAHARVARDRFDEAVPP